MNKNNGNGISNIERGFIIDENVSDLHYKK